MVLCKRCGYNWQPRVEGRPGSCPGCKSRQWDVPRKGKALPRVMELVDGHTGKLRCKVCGAEHLMAIKPMPEGGYYRVSWQCVNKCKMAEMGKKGRTRGKKA